MSRKRRHAPVSYRPPEHLREEFHDRVFNSGLSVNAFITRAVFGLLAPRARRTSPIDQQMAAMLLSQAARISDRLSPFNVVAGDAAAHAATLEACQNELTAIRTCLMDALGRER